MGMATGILEVFGLVAAFVACDAGCKAADVTVENFDKNKPGNADALEVPLIVAIKFRGTVDAVQAAIEAAKIAMNYCLENNIENLTLYFDYEGIEKWANKTWRTKNKYTQAYRNFVDEVRNYINIEFHKVQAHNGDEYNELADKLAKKSLENQ